MNKAYIVANDQQERDVLEKLEREGYLWRGTDMKPTEQQPRIIDEPITIFAQDGKRLGFDYEVNEVYLADYEVEIDFDGRKEEKMSDKYVVSQEFMNELEWWYWNTASGEYADNETMLDLFNRTKSWWVNYKNSNEQNNRLIAIIRWVNGQDVFEVDKPKKWVVRSKETDDDSDYWYVSIYKGLTNREFHKEDATRFDTKEEAESWANSHQEVIEVKE